MNFLPVSGIDVERLEITMDNNTFYLNTPEGFDMPGKLLHIEKNKIKLELNGSEISGGSEEYMLHALQICSMI